MSFRDREHLYVIQCGDHAVKIGASGRPLVRVRSLVCPVCKQRPNIDGLVVLERSGGAEVMLQRAFWRLWIEGEWYRPSERIDGFVAYLRRLDPDDVRLTIWFAGRLMGDSARETMLTPQELRMKRAATVAA